jgi:Zn-dependent peptidase ImmA (M78 family)
MEQLHAIVSGSESITPASAAVISNYVGGSQEFWTTRQNNYDLALERAVSAVRDNDTDVWLAIPHPGPKPRGRMDPQRRRAELKKRLAFFGVSTLGAWRNKYSRDLDQIRFRTSIKLASDHGATSMWLRQAEIDATLADTADWNPDALEARLGEVRKLSRISHPDRFLPKLKALLAEAGVALVVRRAPKGCRASGASRMIAPDKAMILLSFRFRSDEQFWFTLFHEIGHLMLHGEQAFVDGDDVPDDLCEQEANAFAASLIVPPQAHDEFERLRPTHKEIARFAVSQGVAPSLIRGQLEHQGRIEKSRMTFLKRIWQWDEIDQAIASL